MNTSTSSLDNNVGPKNSNEETRLPESFVEHEHSFSPDSDAIVILRKRRLRRGRAIAAAAVSRTAARIAGTS